MTAHFITNTARLARADWRLCVVDSRVNPGERATLYQFNKGDLFGWQDQQAWPDYDLDNGATLGLPAGLAKLYERNRDQIEHALQAATLFDLVPGEAAVETEPEPQARPGEAYHATEPVEFDGQRYRLAVIDFDAKAGGDTSGYKDRDTVWQVETAQGWQTCDKPKSYPGGALEHDPLYAHQREHGHACTIIEKAPLFDDPARGFRTVWRGVEIGVVYKRDYLGGDHLSVYVIQSGQRIPLTETGYRSVFFTAAEAIDEHGSIEAMLHALIDDYAVNPGTWDGQGTLYL